MKLNIFAKGDRYNRSAIVPNTPTPSTEKDGEHSGTENVLGLGYGLFRSAPSAMQLGAVYRCVNVISDSIAQMPVRTYKKTGEHFTEYVQHPVHELLYRFPNKNISRFVLIKNMVCDMLLHGNAYAFIERDCNTMIPIAIHYIPATSVSIQYDINNPVYPDVEYIANGFKGNIQDDDMIHLVNYSNDGINGISTLRHAAQSVELASSSEQHAKKFFSSGANLSGILKVLSSLNDKQRKAIYAEWNKIFRNGDAHGGVAVIPGNMEYQPLSISPVDSQLLETRKFNVIDIARFFGVSPTKLFDMTNSSYSTVEATQLAFLTDTLSPILQKFELEFERKLFLPHERSSIDVRFDTSILVRLDMKTQAEYYRALFNVGAITPNEIRSNLFMPRRSGGDNLYIQGAMTTLENAANGINFQKS